MAEYLHPGVYVEEVSSGVRPIEGVGTSTAGFIGTTLKGIPNKATFITSWAQFVRKFGSLSPNSYLPYAVSQFFENGGKRCYVVRVLNDATATTASATLDDRQSPPQNTLKIEALGAGGWGNDLSVRIEEGTDNPTREFKIVVLHEGRVVEIFDNLSMDGTALNYVETEINDASELIAVTDLDAHTTEVRARAVTSGPLPAAPAMVDFSPPPATMEGSVVVTMEDGSHATSNLNADLLAADLVTRLNNDFAAINVTVSLLATGELVIEHNAAGYDRTFTVALNPTPAQLGGGALAGLEGFHRGQGAAVSAELRSTVAGPFDVSGAATRNLLDLTVDGDTQAIDFEALPADAPAIGATATATAAEIAAVLTWFSQNQMNGLITATADGGTVVLSTVNRGAANSTLAVANNATAAFGFQADDGTADTDTGRGSSEPAFLLSDPGPFALEDGASLSIEVNNDTLGAAVTIPVAISAAAVTNIQGVTAAELAAILNTAAGAVVPASQIAASVVNGRVLVQQVKEGNYYTLQLTDDAKTPNIRLNFETALKRGYVAGDAASPYVRPGHNLVAGVNEPWPLANGDDGSPVSDSDYIGTADKKTGLHALDDVDDVNFVAIPGASAGVASGAVGYCGVRRDLVYIVDSPKPLNGTANEPVMARSFILNDITTKNSYGAFYYPWIEISDPVGKGKNPKRFVPPAGFVAGLYARIDSTRGVWKAPAGTEATLTGVLDLEYLVTDAEQDILNPIGVNCLRKFPAAGTVIWGARTVATQSDPEWRYLPIRRYAIYLEQSIYRGTQWAVFEPNDERLWESLAANITDFMMGEFRKGALAGTTPDQAFRVKCDADLNPESEVAAGRVNMEVKFAPLRPAEFVIIRISQKSQREG